MESGGALDRNPVSAIMGKCLDRCFLQLSLMWRAAGRHSAIRIYARNERSRRSY